MSDDICVAEVREWADGLQEIGELIAPRFARSEPRENAVAYVRGLISDEERKNSWTLSERAGHGTPDPMQRLLSTTDWDPDVLRDDLRSYVVKHLGADDGVLQNSLPQSNAGRSGCSTGASAHALLVLGQPPARHGSGV